MDERCESDQKDKNVMLRDNAMLINIHLLYIHASMVEEKRQNKIIVEFDNVESEEDTSKSERDSAECESESATEHESERDFQNEKSKLAQEKDRAVKLNLAMRGIVAYKKYRKYWDWFCESIEYIKESMGGLDKANTLRDLDEVKHVLRIGFEQLEELMSHICRNNRETRRIREQSKNVGEIRFSL